MEDNVMKNRKKGNKENGRKESVLQKWKKSLQQRLFSPDRTDADLLRANYKMCSRHLDNPVCGIYGPNSMGMAYGFGWEKIALRRDVEIPGSEFHATPRASKDPQIPHCYESDCFSVMYGKNIC